MSSIKNSIPYSLHKADRVLNRREEFRRDTARCGLIAAHRHQEGMVTCTDHLPVVMCYFITFVFIMLPESVIEPAAFKNQNCTFNFFFQRVFENKTKQTTAGILVLQTYACSLAFCHRSLS